LGVATRRSILCGGGLLALVAGVAIVVSWRTPPRPRASVVATIVLTGGSCRTHKAECSKLAHGGTLVIFGPERPGDANFPQHHIRLKGATTRIDVPLAPGDYNLGFFIEPPWRFLEPDFGTSPTEGFFKVGKQTVQLGVVRPSLNWILSGD
jgi:hypothetical protein